MRTGRQEAAAFATRCTVNLNVPVAKEQPPNQKYGGDWQLDWLWAITASVKGVKFVNDVADLEFDIKTYQLKEDKNSDDASAHAFARSGDT